MDKQDNYDQNTKSVKIKITYLTDRKNIDIKNIIIIESKEQ